MPEAYTKEVLNTLKLAELEAFEETRKKYPIEFAAVFEEFANQLKKAFEEQK